jgi:TolB protein
MKLIVRRKFLAVASGLMVYAGIRRGFADSDSGGDPPRRFLIVVPPSSDLETAGGSWRIIAHDVAAELTASGRFVEVKSELSRQEDDDPDAVPLFDKWRGTAVEWLIIGRAASSDQRLDVQFRLWNIAKAEQALGVRYLIKPEDWQRIPHLIADDIYHHLIGEHQHAEGERLD